MVLDYAGEGAFFQKMMDRSAYQISPNLSIFHLFGIIGGGVVVGNRITEAVVLRTDRPTSQKKLTFPDLANLAFPFVDSKV